MTRIEKLLLKRGHVVHGGIKHIVCETITTGRKRTAKIKPVRKAEPWEINDQNRWNERHGFNESAN